MYMPAPSLTATLNGPLGAVLVTSTVTPGNTAPVTSVTVPLRVPVCWALTFGASSSAAHNPRMPRIVVFLLN